MAFQLHEDIEVKANVQLIARERGKIIDLRESHNIFTNIGREYTIDRFLGNGGAVGSAETIEYVGVGIGSNEQTVDTATTYPSLDLAYPGNNIFSDNDPTVSSLERPVQITAGTWMVTTINSKVPSLGPAFTCRCTNLFSASEINLSGAYPVVPISETGLYLTSASPAVNPYTGTPQQVIAYNGFAPISKTHLTSLEIRWELRL